MSAPTRAATRRVAQGRIAELDTGLADGCVLYLGEGVADELALRLRAVSHDRLFLVSSEPLLRRFGAELAWHLGAAGLSHQVVTVEEGERHKSWRELTRLCDRLVAAGATRDSVLVAFGGGMVSNLVGLAAALVFRGVRYVDVPTTLLAQTDGTLSNKQAINGPNGKNQFGTYHAPQFIWADLGYTRHEPERQLKGALVEAAKNGLVNDPEWLDELEARLADGTDALGAGLPSLALRMIESKLAILARDPSERKGAVVLEYGHTCGHAIEWLRAGALLHGEAVAIGMCVAARVGQRLGITAPRVLGRQARVLGEVLGVPTTPPAGLSPARVRDAMRGDNKRGAGGPFRFVLLEDLGRPHNPGGDFLIDVPEGAVLNALQQASGSEGSRWAR